MTRDLALLAKGNAECLTTEQFLAKLDEGLQKKMN
jgi:isocitrate dehydrogenase